MQTEQPPPGNGYLLESSRSLWMCVSEVLRTADRRLTLVVLLFLAMRIVFFQGYLGVGAGHDDVFSSKAYGVAQKWASGSLRLYDGTEDSNALRTGIVIPTAVSYYFLGVNEVSMILYPLVCSMASLLLTMHLGHILFDRNTGVLAGGLLAVFPLDVLYSSVLWPDPAMSMFGLLAITCLLKGSLKESHSSHRRWLYVCGLSVGFAYITKVTGLLILLPVAAYLVYRRASPIHWACVLAGLVCGFVIEAVFFTLSAGDFMLRARLFNPLALLGTSREAIPMAADGEQLPARVLWSFPSMMLAPFNRKIVYFGAFGWFLAAGVVHTVWRRDTKSGFVLSWLALVYLGIILLPISISPLTFAHNVKPVYLHPLVFPTVLIVARSLLFSTHLRKNVFVIGITVLGVSSLCGLLLADFASGRNMAYNSREIARFVRSHPDTKPVYMDAGTKANLGFFLRYEDADLVDFENASLDEIGSGLVVINESMLYRKLLGYRIPDQVLNLPSSWVRVGEIRNPTYSGGLFKAIERLVHTIAGGYAFVSTSGEWGTPQDSRSLKQVFQDFGRPAYIYRVLPHANRS